MTKKSTGVFTNALNGGLYIGLALVIFSVIMWAAGFSNTTSKGTFNFVIQLVIIASILFLTTKSYRDQKLNGTISYGRVIGYGVLATLTSGIILAIYTYLFFEVIDPDALTQMRIAQEEAMLNRGMSPKQVDDAMIIMSKFSNPITMSLGNIINMPFLGLIISLIEGIFLKKQGDPFASAMKDLENEE